MKSRKTSIRTLLNNLARKLKSVFGAENLSRQTNTRSLTGDAATVTQKKFAKSKKKIDESGFFVLGNGSNSVQIPFASLDELEEIVSWLEQVSTENLNAFVKMCDKNKIA